MLIDPSSIPQVEVASMNRIHNEEAELFNELDRLLDAYSRDEIPAERIDHELDTFLQHMQAHFRAEETQMQAIRFPPYPVHKGEHDKVLAVAEQRIQAWKETRDTEALSTFIRSDLPAWLTQHIDTMDRVTAHFFALAGKEVEMG